MYNIIFVGNLGKNIPIFFWNSYFADKKPCGNFCRPRVSIHRGTVTRQQRLEPLPSSRVETRLPRPWRFIFRSGNGGSWIRIKLARIGCAVPRSPATIVEGSSFWRHDDDDDDDDEDEDDGGRSSCSGRRKRALEQSPYNPFTGKGWREVGWWTGWRRSKEKANNRALFIRCDSLRLQNAIFLFSFLPPISSPPFIPLFFLRLPPFVSSSLFPSLSLSVYVRNVAFRPFVVGSPPFEEKLTYTPG